MFRFARTAAVAALALVVAAPGFAEDLTADTVLAEVNGQTITAGNLITLLKSLPPKYQQLPNDVLLKGMLDQMIQQTVLASELGDPSTAEALTLHNQEVALKAGLVLARVADAPISQADLEAAYHAKYDQAGGQTEYNASHILVPTKEEADAIIEQLHTGASFGDLAREKSQDPGSGSQGGNLGWFSKGMMVKPFEDAVTGAKVGEIVGPVQTQFGWHVIQLNDSRIAEAPKLDEVKADLETELRQKAVQDAIADATAKAQITRNDIEGLDPSFLRNEALVK